MRPKAKGEMRSFYECQNSPSLTMLTRPENANQMDTAMVDPWIEQTLAKGVLGLQQEFADLTGTVDPTLMKSFFQNTSTGRNRYRVRCYVV
ncbi:unnamed protein product [Anisakis simplex]|uniref:Enoyl-CoA hydratase n=1 Tax=Anisakis simplex TaxID=6269 RepID=A0A0M3J074_ANISI|nr:unnamed protein product [Anisakis simplex]